MADYVLSAKGTYDGSNMDGGLDKSASKLSGLKDTAKSVGSQVAGFFASSFGSVGKSIATAIGTVTAGVTTLAATGGMSRALNIEKAQAMFKGMKLEWGDFYQTIQDSVDGTAFGFDTAATAAAQLAASGVAAGSDMEKALNGCVGTAATFSQDLGDLSSIWAKVAANGKLSGEQVAQFTDRGINAISVLSTYLGKSSDEVSAMVTAGKIDFQTFSDAMYASFGDSAKAANESFTGSMANMKAALSKIGQDWMTPLKDSAIPVFNSIRGVLNSCRAALKPLSTAFGEFLGVTYDAQGNLTRTGGAVEKLCTFLDGLAEKIKGVDLSQLGTGGQVAAAALAALAAVSLGGLIGQIPVLGALANSLTGGIIPAIKGVATGFAALSAPAAVAVAAITAFAAIFAYSMATNEAFRNQIIGIASSIASSLAPAFQSLTGLAEPLQGLFAAAVIVVNSFALALGGLVAAVAPVIATIVSGLVPIISTIIDAVGQIALVITTTLCPIIQQVTDLITANMPVIQEVITGVLTVIQTIISTVLPVMVEIFSSTMAAIQAVIDAVWPYISAIVTAAMNAIQAIVTIVLGIINQD
jgi:tape measure domain-containing protein